MKLTDYYILESAITKKVLSLWDSPLQSIAEQVYLKNYAKAKEIATEIVLPTQNLRNFVLATFQSCGAYGALLAESNPHFLGHDIYGISATHLVTALETSVSDSIRAKVVRAIDRVQEDPSLIDDEEESRVIITIQKAPSKEKYIKDFVSFADDTEELVKMVSALHTSRLSTWGFTMEAEYLGIEKYRLEAVLDGKTSDFCRHIAHGKEFLVEDAKAKVTQVLNAPTEDAKFLQPWVKGTKAVLAELSTLSASELTLRGLHIPPFHPYCRTMCLRIDSKLVLHTPHKEVEEGIVVPDGYNELQLEKALEPLAEALAKHLALKATKKAMKAWNDSIKTDTAQTLAKLTSMPLAEVEAGLLDNQVTLRALKDGSVNLKGKAEVNGGEQEFSYNLNAIDKTLRINYLNYKNVDDAPKAFGQQFHSVVQVAEANAMSKIIIPTDGNTTFMLALLDLSFVDIAALQVALLKKLNALNKAYPTLIGSDYAALSTMINSSNLSEVGLQSIAKYPLKIGASHIGELLFMGIKGEAVLDLTNTQVVESLKTFLNGLW